MVPGRAEFIEGELSDRSKLEQIFSAQPFDGVMHFAALIEAGESMRRPELYFRNNSAATLTLIEAMLMKGVNRLVFSSTAAVYGEPESTPIKEDAPLRPTNVYGESKLLVEQMLAWVNRVHGFRYASLRYFNVAGANEGRGEAHEPESHLIPLILDVALGRRKSIKVFGQDYPTRDGTCIRDYIHIQDLAQAHILGLEPGKSGFFNLGNGDGYSVKEVIHMCEKVTGKKIPAVEKPRRPGDPPKLVAAAHKAFTELGWKPRYPKIEDIVKTAWAWHQKNPEGYPD